VRKSHTRGTPALLTGAVVVNGRRFFAMGDAMDAFLGRMASRATRAMMAEVDRTVDAMFDCSACDIIVETGCVPGGGGCRCVDVWMGGMLEIGDQQLGACCMLVCLFRRKAAALTSENHHHHHGIGVH